jgi:16S rRNA (guanine527-N7)-methyltransferase
MLILNKYFNLTLWQRQQFDALQAVYSHWNAKVNLISRKDMANLYERHVLHSLGIAKVVHFKPQTTIMDVGTGGGFPGIPLAILFPECEFLLVDSIGKKIKVVNKLAEQIGLKNVQTMNTRAENVVGTFDFVVSRAVTTLAEFYPLVKGRIKSKGFNDESNGILYLKGGDVQEELDELIKNSQQSIPIVTGSNRKPEIAYKVFNLSDYFEEEFFETKKVIHISNTPNKIQNPKL